MTTVLFPYYGEDVLERQEAEWLKEKKGLRKKCKAYTRKGATKIEAGKKAKQFAGKAEEETIQMQEAPSETEVTKMQEAPSATVATHGKVPPKLKPRKKAQCANKAEEKVTIMQEAPSKTKITKTQEEMPSKDALHVRSATKKSKNVSFLNKLCEMKSDR